ncbi:MAG: pyridoxal phosphate-dependent aminotransferase [Candidatus Heimdallarchaeota archaeon]|nr:pyridoxal phosphate-dependent aminotransferase [Candidatus Heimdallarchaeota archaeon]
MSMSQIARSIPTSSTLKMNELARKLREKGEKVIHLGSGEPKSKVPIDAILNAASKLNTAEIRYTPADGTLELKRSIIRYMEENYFKEVMPENIIISNGAKQSIFTTLQAIINPQDEVIFMAPYWVSYPHMVTMLNGVPVAVQPEDGRFHPRLEDIKEKVSSYTKAIIINSPNNPTGAVYPESFIKEIVEFAEKKGIWLIMDDIYHKLIFDGKKAISPYKFATAEGDKSKLVVINGVSKAYAMTGFRIGWTVGNKKLIESMTNLQGHTTHAPSALLQSAAVGALDGVQSSVEALRLDLENKRNIMYRELKGFEGLKIQKSEGTFYTFVDFSAYNKDSVALALEILEKAKVVTVPGKDFGMDGHLRLSYCGTIKEIIEGVQRIKWVLDPNSPNEIFIGDRKLVRDWQ